MKKYILISLLIIILISISYYFYFPSILWGKYYGSISITSGEVPTWPIAEDIIKKDKEPAACEDIVVRNPSKTENSQTAHVRCYSDLAEKLRDKSVCSNLQRFPNANISACEERIDAENARDLGGLERIAKNIMYMQIQKKDKGKTLKQFIRGFLEPHLKSSVLPDRKKKYGYDVEIILPSTISSTGEHKIILKLIPQNVQADITINIDNPFNIILQV